MSYTRVRFKWSTITTNHFSDEWVIKVDDLINKRYTYYWWDESQYMPIRAISAPIFVGDQYISSIGLCDEKWTSHSVNIDEIKDISELRNIKLNQIGI